MSLPPSAQGSIAGGVAFPLPVRESHPLEAPSLAWRAEIRAGEVIQEHVEAHVEQIAASVSPDARTALPCAPAAGHDRHTACEYRPARYRHPANRRARCARTSADAI